jgi:DNA polymerase-3 subunit delta
MLVGLVGDDLGQVSREVEKASLLALPGKPITGAEIQQACSLTAEAVVWDFTTALASRNAERALAALHRLLEDGEAPHRLMGSVVWQLRTVLQVAELVRRGRSDEEIRSTLKLRSDLYFKIRRRLGQSLPSAALMMEQLARANRAMNSSRVGTRRVIEHLVLDLCRPTG